MEVYIISKDLNTLSVIDYCSSIIWTNRYNKPGDFELYVPVTEKALSLLKIGNFVFLENDTKNVMIIEKVEISTDYENNDYITATGISAEKFIKNRIAWGLNEMTGTAGECIRQLLNDNLISPEDFERRNELVQIGTLAEGFEITKQTTGTNLLEAIEAILDAQHMGHFMEFIDGLFYFSTYEGADRSYNQDQNSKVIFSPSFDNLLATDYTQDSENYANVALIAGEGEGIDRKMAAVGDASGVDRVEIYVDARQTSSNTETPLTEEEYISVLKDRGIEALAEKKTTESFEAEIDPGTVYFYKKDYYLGDIVTIINEYGIQVDARIIEAIESWNEEGYKLIVNFEKKEG